jgi:hypothetical protein
LGECHTDGSAPGIQPTRGNKSSPAVAAAARKDGHSLAPRVPVEKPASGEIGEAAARVFHHLDQFNPEVLNHRPVDLNHLHRGEAWHQGVIEDGGRDHDSYPRDYSSLCENESRFQRATEGCHKRGLDPVFRRAASEIIQNRC